VASGQDQDVNPDELVDEIEQVRERLASTIDELIDRTNPKNIAKRGLASVKAKFVDEQGGPRFETILPVVGGALALAGLIVVIRRVVND